MGHVTDQEPKHELGRNFNLLEEAIHDAICSLHPGPGAQGQISDPSKKFIVGTFQELLSKVGQNNGQVIPVEEVAILIGSINKIVDKEKRIDQLWAGYLRERRAHLAEKREAEKLNEMIKLLETVSEVNEDEINGIKAEGEGIDREAEEPGRRLDELISAVEKARILNVQKEVRIGERGKEEGRVLGKLNDNTILANEIEAAIGRVKADIAQVENLCVAYNALRLSIGLCALNSSPSEIVKDSFLIVFKRLRINPLKTVCLSLALISVILLTGSAANYFSKQIFQKNGAEPRQKLP